MNISAAFLIFAVASATWGVIVAVRILAELNRRGIDTSFVLLRLYFFRYLNQYRQVTIRETGKTGPLFTSYILSMNLALICAVAALILRAA